MKQKQIEEECRFSICFEIKISNSWRKSRNRNRLRRNACLVSVLRLIFPIPGGNHETETD